MPGNSAVEMPRRERDTGCADARHPNPPKRHSVSVALSGDR